MKSIITLALTSLVVLTGVASTADARSPRRPAPDVYSASSIVPTLGDVFVAVPRCPPAAACAPITDVTLVFTLAGCVDRLGPVHYDVRQDAKTGKTIIAVSGVNLHTEASTRVRCFAPATETRTVTIPGAYLTAADIEIVPLSTL